MDSGSSAALAAGGLDLDLDRLSMLSDAALGHILSFLPATEAARTAALSRRWRHVFAAVHTLSFSESEPRFRTGYRYWRLCDYCDAGEARAPPPRFVSGVTTALNGRHRGARAATAPLRALRVAFDEFGFRGGGQATQAVDGWLSYAVHGAGDEALEIDLRLGRGTGPVCQRACALRSGGGHGAAGKQDDDDSAEYVVPRSLFSSCAVLRALRLGSCTIDLPSAIALPSLDTLHLTTVTGRGGGGGAIQRLVSACPSLVDLTLEACGDLTALSLHGAHRLRRLALRCCHRLATVTVDGAPELRALEYRGDIPPASLLHPVPVRRKISFCAFDFCGVERGGGELLGLTDLLAGVQRLHLTSARLGSCCFASHGGAGAGAFAFPCLPMLRSLEMTGMLTDDDESAVATVARVLERTPRLETLSLFFLPEPHNDGGGGSFSGLVDKEVLSALHELRYDPRARLAAAPPSGVEVPSCLRETTVEISFVHYQGSVAQRKLAKFLLCNAAVVDEVCWKVARGPLSMQTKLMEEIRGWVANKSANMMFF